MPDYTRLVSYIYNYEEGLKRNNVGYARVEARNGQCKCTLHITAPSLNEKQLKAYLFTRKDGNMKGILFGTFPIKNGTGDYKMITDSAHIMNSPYSITDMGGIVLYLTDNKFFATEWDDVQITKEMVSSLDEKPNQDLLIRDRKIEKESEQKLEKETEQLFVNVPEQKAVEEPEVIVNKGPEQIVEDAAEQKINQPKAADMSAIIQYNRSRQNQGSQPGQVIRDNSNAVVIPIRKNIQDNLETNNDERIV